MSKTPPRLKVRLQQSEVRQHQLPVPEREPTDGMISALQASKPLFLGRARHPGLRPGLSEIGPSGLNRKRGQNMNKTRAHRARRVSWVMTRAKAQATVFVLGVRSAGAMASCPFDSTSIHAMRLIHGREPWLTAR